jgi:hypothetical protein
VLKEAFNPVLELEDKKRVALHANALNRSADQAERSMMERRRYRRAYPTFPVPQPDTTEPDDAQAQAQVAQAVASYPAAPPKPAKPGINPPPIQRSATHHGNPDRTNMPPKRPDAPITPAMPHAATANSPTPHPS